MVGLLPKLIIVIFCCPRNVDYALPTHVSEGSWEILPSGLPQFLALYYFHQLISAKPMESTKQKSWGTTQGCKKIFLRTLGCTCDKVHKHAETTPRLGEKEQNVLAKN